VACSYTNPRDANEQAGEAFADAGLSKVKALYERVRARLTLGNYRGALLRGVQAEPEDPGRQEILKAELAKLIAADPQVAGELERLVADAELAGAVHRTARWPLLPERWQGPVRLSRP
jgi:hypothetical protein